MGAEFLAVQVNGGVPVDAVELDADALAFPIGRRTERLAIPADAAGEKAAAGSRWGCLCPARTLDAPVMWQLHRAPG